MDVDDLIATAQPRTDKVRICARGDLVARHAEAVTALQAASAGDDSLAGSPDTTAAASAVVAVEDEMDAATVEFTVASVSRHKWANLLAKHPPSAQDRRAGHDHDPDKFPVAVVAECAADPELSPLQAQQLADVLPPGEWNKLWIAVLSLNITATPAPKLAAATELLRANEQSSTTPPPEASLADGSSDGSGEQ